MVNSTEEKRSRTGFGQRLLRAFFVLFCTLLLLAVSLTGVVFFYTDEIKAEVISALNKRLRAEVKVDPDDIDVTIISTFPACALRFDNVLMYEAIDRAEKDTLLFAESIRLHFDLFDIWKGNYTVRKISINDALLRPKVSEKGVANYLIWKEVESTEPGLTSFRLEDFTFRNVKLTYSNNKQQVKTRLAINDLKLSGNFSAEKYNVHASADVFAESVSVNRLDYLTNRHLEWNLQLDVNENFYQISKGNLHADGLELGLEGEFRYRDEKAENLRIKYTIRNQEIKKLLSFLSADRFPWVKEYSATGVFNAAGEVVYDQTFHWRADFGASGGTLRFRDNNTRAENIQIAGTLNAGEELQLEIQSFSAEVTGGRIKGSLRLEGWNDPFLTLETNSDADLASLHQLLPFDTIEEIQGDFQLNLKLAGRLSEIKKFSFHKNVDLKGEAAVRDLIVRFRHDRQSYKVTSCGLRARAGQFEVQDLRLTRGQSDLIINGVAPDLLNFLAGEPVPLVIRGDLKAGFLRLEDFLPAADNGEREKNTALIPPQLVLTVNSRIDTFSFGKFYATHLNGLIELRNRKLMVSDLRLMTMQGSAVIDALADNSGNDLKISVDSRLADINVQDLFSQMNDFGQQTLRSDHIRGLVTADLSFFGRWNGNLVCDAPSVKADCDLRIKQGELIGFSPLKSLGRFVDVEELDHIRFSNLRSKIEIADELIAVSQTTVENSVLDFEFSGTHTFAHRVNYHFRMLTRDLIAAKKGRADRGEFGEISADAENNRSVFIVMEGFLDDPRIRYDRRGMQEKIREDMREEKRNMKRLLKEEFGLFCESDIPAPEKEQPVFKLVEPERTKQEKKNGLVLKKKEEEDF